MIDSGRRALSFALNLSPDQWWLLDVENPTVIYALFAYVSSEYNQVGFSIRESVAIPFSRRFVRYINYVPHSNSISDVQVVQIV